MSSSSSSKNELLCWRVAMRVRTCREAGLTGGTLGGVCAGLAWGGRGRGGLTPLHSSLSPEDCQKRTFSSFCLEALL